MPDDAPPIFRHEALSHSVQGSHRTVLPSLIRPRTFLCLWILITLLVGAVVLVCTARVPVFASGIAVVTAPNGARLVLLLPAEYLDELDVGQNAWIAWPEAREPLSALITAVEPAIHSPLDIRERFALSAAAVNGPTVVAFADSDEALPLEPGISAEAFRGSTAPVQVEVGARPLLSLLLQLDEGG